MLRYFTRHCSRFILNNCNLIHQPKLNAAEVTILLPQFLQHCRFASNFTKTIIEETIASIENSPPEPKTVSETVSTPHWVQNPVDYQIYKASNVEDLLKVVEKYRLTGLQCVSFITRLCSFAPLNVAKLEKDVRFRAVCEIIKNEVQFFTPGSILLALRSFLFINNDSETSSAPVFQLRNAVRRLLRLNIPTASLVKFACFHVDHAKNTAESKKLQQEMEETIVHRLSEINDVELILMMLNKINWDANYAKTVEMRALDMIDAVKMEHLNSLLNYLSKTKSRNLYLLKGALKKACDDNKVLPVKTLFLLLTVANHLTYYEIHFINRICEDLEIQIESIDKDIIVQQLCFQIGNARLRHEKVLTSFVNWVEKNFDFCTPNTLCTFVIMLARCNFLPPVSSSDNIFAKIRDYLTLDVVKENRLWLDYVWALSILELLTNNLAASVLDKNFYNALFTDNESKNLIFRLKLLNINTAAKHELKNYDGPFVEDSFIESLPPPDKHTLTKYKAYALEMFMEAFTKVTKNTVVKNRLCPAGYVIDVEIRTDNEFSPLKVDQWDDNSKEQIKIAIMIRNYFDKTLVSDKLSGLNAMAVRHLELIGYEVVEINANEMASHKQGLPRSAFLKELFEEKRKNVKRT